jgi:hypothetical protein
MNMEKKRKIKKIEINMKMKYITMVKMCRLQPIN